MPVFVVLVFDTIRRLVVVVVVLFVVVERAWAGFFVNDFLCTDKVARVRMNAEDTVGTVNTNTRAHSFPFHLGAKTLKAAHERSEWCGG